MFSPGTLRVYLQEGYSTSVEERDVITTLRVVWKKFVVVSTLNNVDVAQTIRADGALWRIE
jgi:hypothetical protein